MGMLGNESLLGESLNCLADRGAAHAEVRGESRLDETFAGVELARDDRLSDRPMGLVCQAIAVDRLQPFVPTRGHRIIIGQ